jgi:predicted DCC family thiol-disulfide oxidoreductase YuxK
MNESPVILFDGVCNLCNGAVQFVIRHDSTALFKFASLQSEEGQQLLNLHNLPVTGFNSFVLIQNGKSYTQSDAALLVAKQLDGPVKFLYGLIIVPSIIRNGVYNFIAKNRYKWFGKQDSCMIPDQSTRKRFI